MNKTRYKFSRRKATRAHNTSHQPGALEMPVRSLQALAAAVLVEHESELDVSLDNLYDCEPFQSHLLEGARMVYDCLPLHDVEDQPDRSRFIKQHKWFWVDPQALASRRTSCWKFYPCSESLVSRIPSHMDMTPLLCSFLYADTAWLRHPCKVFDVKEVFKYHATDEPNIHDVMCCMTNLGPKAFLDADPGYRVLQKVVRTFSFSWFSSHAGAWRAEAVARGLDDFVAAMDSYAANATR